MNIYLINLGLNNQVLCIRNIDIETLGSYEEFLVKDGFQITNIMSKELSHLELHLNDYDAIFVMGGPMSANDRDVYLDYEKRLISNAIASQIPLMGICLGSQLIAASCGGRVFQGMKKEIGWGEVDITEKGIKSVFKNQVSNLINVFHWHGDTFSLPENAEVLAFNKKYIQAFKYGSAIGIQFHLEVNQQMIERWSKKYSAELQAEKIYLEDFIREKEKDFSELNNVAKGLYAYFKSLF